MSLWRLGRTETFARTARRYLRRHYGLEKRLERVLERLQEQPFHPQLHTHALSGRLQGLYAVSVTYQVRLIVRIDEKDHTVILIDLGDQDSVYR